MSYKQLVSQHMHPHPCCLTCLPQHCRKVSQPQGHPSLFPSPSCCTPHPTWKSCWISPDPDFSVQPHTESIYRLFQAPTQAPLLGLCVPPQLQEIATYSQQKVARSACLLRKLLPATCTHTCSFSTLRHAQLELLCANELNSWKIPQECYYLPCLVIKVIKTSLNKNLKYHSMNNHIELMDSRKNIFTRMTIFFLTHLQLTMRITAFQDPERGK